MLHTSAKNGTTKTILQLKYKNIRKTQLNLFVSLDSECIQDTESLKSFFNYTKPRINVLCNMGSNGATNVFINSRSQVKKEQKALG